MDEPPVIQKTRDASSQTFIQDNPGPAEEQSAEAEGLTLPIISVKQSPDKPLETTDVTMAGSEQSEKSNITFDSQDVIVHPDNIDEPPQLDNGESPQPPLEKQTKVKLPEVHMFQVNFSHDLPETTPRQSSRYVERYKATMKIKGIKAHQLFSLDRSTRNQKKTEESKPTGSSALPVIQNLPDNNSGVKAAKYDKGKQTVHKSNIEKKNISGKQKSPHSELEKHLNQVVANHRGTPGVQRTRSYRPGRKLGSIVSAERMSQLLDTNDPLKMEDCFNYYP